MWLFLWVPPRHPLGQERLFVHGKALVHGCHVCFFNLAGIPVILSKSNISPIFKNSSVWRFYTCCNDRSWPPAAKDSSWQTYHKWTIKLHPSKWQNPKRPKAVHCHSIDITHINNQLTIFQFLSPHDDLIGFWWSFDAGNASKANYPFRQGTESSHSESDHLTIGSDLAKIQLQMGGGPSFKRIKPIMG